METDKKHTTVNAQRILAGLNKEPRLERIGESSCGSICGPPSHTSHDGKLCIKRGDPKDKGCTPVLYDYEVHRMIHPGLSELPYLVTANLYIPRCQLFLPKEDPGWNVIIHHFPGNFEPSDAMVIEEIRPITPYGRMSLLRRYCPRHTQEPSMIIGKNQHCLLCPYLGRRRPAVEVSRRELSSLRDNALHMDQLEDLGLPSFKYAEIMARCLALLHWALGVDGKGIEFVLGRPRPEDPGWKSDSIGKHRLWMVDFEHCEKFAEDVHGVEQVVEAFWGNGPFFPRPGSDWRADRVLWEVFADEYKWASRLLIGFLKPQKEIEKFMVLVRRVVVRIKETTGAHGKTTRGNKHGIFGFG